MKKTVKFVETLRSTQNINATIKTRGSSVTGPDVSMRESNIRTIFGPQGRHVGATHRLDVRETLKTLHSNL